MNEIILKTLKTGKNVVITGFVDSGKTLFCSEFADFLLQNSYGVAGFLTEKKFIDEKFIGYDIAGFKGFGIMPFIRYTPFTGEVLIRLDKFYFSQKGFEFGQKLLKEDTDFYIIDEFGPIEFNKNGFYYDTKRLLSDKKPIVVVVRQGLVSDFLELFKEYNFEVISNRHSL